MLSVKKDNGTPLDAKDISVKKGPGTPLDWKGVAESIRSVSEEGEDNGRSPGKERLTEIIQRVCGMVLLYGAQKKITIDEFPVRVEPMPFSLFPSVMPKNVIDESLRLHTHFQTVMYKVANNHDFMHTCLKDILVVDEFTRQFWRIYETVRNEGVLQNISLMMTRNDFMMEATDETECNLQIKHVELNTFSSAAGGVISALNKVHRYSLSIAGIPYKEEQLPNNQPTTGLARGLAKAWELYGNQSAVILFVVGVPEPNTPDQMWLERDIFQINEGISVIYRTFQQLLEQTSLGNNKELIVDEKEVSVVYYRHGYSPLHYPSSKEYDLRLQIERSKAIKCPTMAVHLAGCKKIQQVLTEEGVLEQFIDDADVVTSLRASFVGQFILDPGDEGDANVRMALQSPEKYVLKPQREGGGNCYFGEELRHVLESIQHSPERKSWILMEKIKAFKHRNRLVRVGLTSDSRDVVSELGIFGVHISTPTEEVTNFHCGYLLRTKPEEVNEAGLFSGQSCLDSPYLV